MGLPLYLAMTAEEMACSPALPRHIGWFSPADGQAIPESLPPEAVLILTDPSPFRLTPERLRAIRALNCGGVLLDLERPPEPESVAAVRALAEALPCPIAAPPGFIEDTRCAVFLPPCPLHVPLAEHLAPWGSREIWLDIAAQQQTVTVTGNGTAYGPVTPADMQVGVLDEGLCCQVITRLREEAAAFTLFDTADTLKKKLARAEALGVSCAVGLYQQLLPLHLW